MAPGDIREAAFDVSVDAGATAKEYGLDSEVIYRDSLNNQFTSDPMKVNVHVVPEKVLLTCSACRLLSRSSWLCLPLLVT